MPYEIGYRKPPKSGQFKKGTSGNPKGRPKGSKNFLTVLEKELSQKVVVTENGRRKKVTRLEAMVKRLVSAALQGDPKATLNVLDILKRTGGLDMADTEALLPVDHENLLDQYIQEQIAAEVKAAKKGEA